jgi:hypothetical protein
MTVVSLVISRQCSAHASDSFLTIRNDDGSRRIIKSQKSKIVGVRHFRGAMAFWGMGKIGSSFTYDWLKRQVQDARDFDSPEAFAHAIANRLNERIARQRFVLPIHRGIGIHFSSYENVDGFWIPELFLIANWHPPYQKVAGMVTASRHTYHWVTNQRNGNVGTHGQQRFRLRVREFLNNNGMLIFNNGDPEMFNQVGGAVFHCINTLEYRGIAVQSESLKRYTELARLPVEVVSKIQESFCRRDEAVTRGRRNDRLGRDFRLVGGRIHDLTVTPEGRFYSTSGDGV